MEQTKFFVMDVDGTLTDGKIYMGKDGELVKAFDIKDGCGILLVLPKYNITPVIITARKSKILENRCSELGIKELHQGVRDKLSMLKRIVGDDLRYVAYVGDDLPDIPCMEETRQAGGVVLCPADAISEVKALSNFVSGKKAGDGAIRDCINYIVQQNKSNLNSAIAEVVESILAGDYSSGTINGNPFSIQEYETKEESECLLETHRNHIDVQYIMEGCELLNTYYPSGLTSLGEYDREKDVEFWQGGFIASSNYLVKGSIIVIYNGQPHKGAIKVHNSEVVRKLVCKIVVNNYH